MTGRWAIVALAVAVAVVRAASAQSRACTAEPAMDAERLVAAERFWHAERVAPALPRAPRPVPVGLAVLHARIRAGLERWADVGAVLRRAPGADTVPDALVAWAGAAERLADWAAAERRYRQLAELPGAPSDLRARALVGRAVALEALRRPDSARAAWARAELALPTVADWLSIRRARLEPDTAEAFAAATAGRTPGARRRGDLVIAERRERARNLAGALEIYRRLGSDFDVVRLEWARGRRRTARLLADSLLDPPMRAQAAAAAGFLAERYSDLTPRELTGVARVRRAFGDLEAAETFLLRAIARESTTVAPWLELASLRVERRDRHGALAAIDSAAPRARRRTASLVAYTRIATLAALRDWDEADRETARAVRAFPGDTNIAKAVLLMADRDRALARPAAEAVRYGLLLRRFPSAPATNVGRLRLGLADYAKGQRDSAAAWFAEAVAQDSADRLAAAPRFWDARVRFEAGESTGRTALQRLAEEEPFSYYGVRARELIGDTAAVFTDTVLSPLPEGSLSPARAHERIHLLASLGLEDAAREEALGWTADSTASVHALLAAAGAAAEVGFAREAIRLGEAARASAGIRLGVMRGLMPFPFRTMIEHESSERCLDPLLLAAIIRQESRFTARAVSRAGARGLSQVLPATGRELTAGTGIRRWDPDLLFIPDFNLHLGTRYLADRLHVNTFPVHAALAAYNAGVARVTRWRSWPEFADPDQFVERIPIAETRNYVKTVYASYRWYQHTYAEPGAAAPRYP